MSGPSIPVGPGPYRLTMGLHPLDLTRWLDVDHHRGDELTYKAQLLRDRHDQVMAALPGTSTGGSEVLELVVDHLERTHPGLVVVDDTGIRERSTGAVIDPSGLHPLDVAGRLVQEDLCLMTRVDGAWILGAASVCFPSRWSLADKLGRELSAIHGPVPGYQEKLAGPTGAFFDRLTPTRPRWRVNWTLIDDPDLHQPDPATRWPSRAPEHEPEVVVPEGIWFRVERQTLRRLELHEAVLFTIRTSVTALDQLVVDHPEVVPALLTTLPTVPPETVRYKGWTAVLPRVLDWLREQETGPG